MGGPKIVAWDQESQAGMGRANRWEIRKKWVEGRTRRESFL